MYDIEDCQDCMCPTCFNYQTEKCLEGKDFCEVCEGDCFQENCPLFESDED